MKILCTADWHLGKKLEGFSRFDEQVQALDEICSIAERENPDAVLIAGDCFDTSAPPPECARLFVRTLARLSRGGECPVLVIAGNHDSPSYLSSTEAFASQVGVMILGRPGDTPLLENASKNWEVCASAPGMIEISFKKYPRPLRFLLSPYADARRLKKDLGTEDSELKAWQILKAQWQENTNPDALNILAAHHFFIAEPAEGVLISDAPLTEDEGERRIAGVGGALGIPLAEFPEGITYAVFGHIHRPQSLSCTKTKAFYTGSPLIYSLSESGQQKSLLMLEIGKKQSERPIPLGRRADVKKLVLASAEGLEEILAAEQGNYLEIIWAAGRYLEGHERRLIESAHPRVLRITSAGSGAGAPPPLNPDSLKTQNISDLFAEYFASKNEGALPGPSLGALFADISADAPEPELPKKHGFLPLSLTIEGVYSYRKKTSIDFTRLGSTGLFGVFGAVGSGKSTLIEAVVFALYGGTERLSGSKSNLFSSAYNMLNQNSEALSIEFVFQVFGEDGEEEYKITHTGKRKKTEAEFTGRHVYRKMKGEWVPITEKSSDKKGSGDQLLGLSYNDFRKTIVLQQRDFMSFLSSTGKDNSETLQRLFRLERFDLFAKAAELKKAFEIEIQKVEAHQSVLARYSPEEEARLEAEGERLGAELPPLGLQLARVRAEKSDLLLGFEAQKNRQNLESELKNAEAAASSASLHLSGREPELARLRGCLDKIEAEEAALTPRLQALEELLKDDPAPELARLSERLRRIGDLHVREEASFRQAGFSGTLEALKEEGIRLRAEIDRKKAEAPLAAAAALLKEGRPCPLCGSTAHPLPYHGDTGELSALEKSRETLHDAYLAIKECRRALLEECGKENEETLRRLFAELSAKGESLKGLKTESAALMEKREALGRRYRGESAEFASLQSQQSADRAACAVNTQNAENLKTKLSALPPAPPGDFPALQKALEAQIDSLEEQRQALIDTHGAVKKALSDTKEGLRAKKELNAKWELFKLRLDDADILHKMFKGGGFVKFIGQKYMEQLCYAANKRFSAFTGGRFAFLAPKEAEKNISLIDCHNGGSERDLSTLSGGQSFQAALALAAALADESGAGHRFFFIDEGFGSLDAASLQAVIDTLSALAQEEGRLIGLISHVESLRDEISAALFVSLDKDGSRVELREP